MNLTFEFPERLWKRPIEFHEGRPRLRVAASSYNQETHHQMFADEHGSDQLDNSAPSEPQVKVTTEAGNAKVTVELVSVNKEDLKLNCAEDSVTLSVRSPAGSWTKEIRLPFRVDPDTAKAVFRNGKLDLVVRTHGKFNPPRPKLDWV